MQWRDACWMLGRVSRDTDTSGEQEAGQASSAICSRDTQDTVGIVRIVSHTRALFFLQLANVFLALFLCHSITIFPPARLSFSPR